MISHFLPAVSKDDIAHASSSFVKRDVTVTLSRAEPFFTVGYLTACAKTPLSKRSLENSKAKFSFPTITGIICPFV